MPRWPRRLPVLVFALGILLAGAVTASAGTVQAPAATQLTPLLVSATNAPLSVLASDGLKHLEYDLILTNLFPSPLTVTSLDVTAPDGSVLLHLAGDALATQMQPLSGPAAGTVPTTQIAAGGAAATVIDLALPAGTAPGQIGHQIGYALPADAPGLSLLTSRTVSGPDLTVDPRAAIVLAPPVHGAGWLSANGCCLASSVHRFLRFVVDGARFNKPETFAIDWVQLQDGRLFSGDGSRNEQYAGYGAGIVAAAPGTVVSVRDGMPEQTPNQPVVGVNAPDDAGGNNVVVQIGPDVWAFYAHLQPGSVAVQVGDRVTTGQLLGRLGNSGNSSAPHLHFQLSDGPDILLANSLPFVFDRYTLAGTVDESLNIHAADPEEAAGPGPAAFVPIAGTPQAQAGTYPLDQTVQDFP